MIRWGDSELVKYVKTSEVNNLGTKPLIPEGNDCCFHSEGVDHMYLLPGWSDLTSTMSLLFVFITHWMITQLLVGLRDSTPFTGHTLQQMILMCHCHYQNAPYTTPMILHEINYTVIASYYLSIESIVDKCLENDMFKGYKKETKKWPVKILEHLSVK